MIEIEPEFYREGQEAQSYCPPDFPHHEEVCSLLDWLEAMDQEGRQVLCLTRWEGGGQIVEVSFRAN